MIDVLLGVGCDQDVQPDHCAGSVAVGLKGFLSLLETQLGLPGSDVSLTRRQIQYQTCLQQKLTESIFYHRSFQADPFSTSRTLLQWRDSLYLGGWKGSFSDLPAGRLADIEAVETLARGVVSASEGERVQRVLSVLQQQQVQISSVRLFDPLELFPPLWQRVLCVLRDDKRVALEQLNPLQTVSDDGSDLAVLQRQLIEAQSDDAAVNAKTLQGDGTVLFVQAGSSHISAAGVAELIHQRSQQSSPKTLPEPDYLLLAEQQGDVLDAALDRAGLTRLGYHAESPWRPVFQVLPLVFELCWEPLNPSALLQFLNHPLGPLPQVLRSQLADVVAGQPGIGGDQWKLCIKEYLANQAADDPDWVDAVAEQVSFWLECERFEPVSGMQVSAALDRAEALQTWLRERHAASVRQSSQRDEMVPDLALFAAAMSQCAELTDALSLLVSSGLKTITREGLRRLIEDVRGSGIGLVDCYPQASVELPVLTKAERPASVLAAHDVVIWWDCQKTAAVRRWHWFAAERDELARQGVTLWDERAQLQLQTSSWLRPLLAATKQLVFVQHADVKQHHAVLDLIAVLTEGAKQISLEQSLLENSPIPLAGIDILPAQQKIKPQPLPSKSRWWQLPADCDLPKREKESYSSIEQFINSPYQWVLNYQARLRSSSLLQLSDQNRLKGSMAHRLFEHFFAQHGAIKKIQSAVIGPWIRSEVQPLLACEGAVLLMPGRLAEREQFIEQVTHALTALVEQLQAANVVSVTMEQEQSGNFVGGQLVGNIDLLAVNKSGEEAVIDIKWGGYKYRQASMKTDDYLQLATYAKLRLDTAKKWPALAFFFITDAKLLTFDAHYFPKGKGVETASGESVAAYWQRIEQTWKWRRSQMDSGKIEVTIRDTEADEDSQPGEKGVEVPDSSDRYNDFTALTGWRAKV